MEYHTEYNNETWACDLQLALMPNTDWDLLHCSETAKALEKGRCLKRISIYQSTLKYVREQLLQLLWEAASLFWKNIMSVLTQLAISAKQLFH